MITRNKINALREAIANTQLDISQDGQIYAVEVADGKEHFREIVHLETILDELEEAWQGVA